MYVEQKEIIKLQKEAAKLQDKYFKRWQKDGQADDKYQYLSWQSKEIAYQNVLNLFKRSR
jgi:hypothetical protein